jgi:hypothetical protein
MFHHHEDDNSTDADASSSPHPDVTSGKRRRLHGACDACRRKKIKCDSAKMPRNTCTNCISSKVECTHNIPRQKKKDTQKEYIRSLELRLEQMQGLLRAVWRLLTI